MGEVYFYHLTQRPIEDTLRVLLLKSLEAGWRVAVRGRTDAMLEMLDAALWRGADDAFLPHGRAGGPHDALQPVLLTIAAAANAPDCLVSVEGADVAPEDVTAMARVMVLFDGHDDGALQTAREQWKLLTGAGCGAKYWSEESGKWQMKRETAASP